MAKKRRSKKTIKKPFNWKKNAKWLALACVAVIVSGYLFVTGENKSRIEHDLSVIGKGKATLVQIHDPGCQLCRRLKTNVDAVRPDFEDKVHFKTANIKTNKGAEFAKKHNVPHVTLLIFNRNGKRVNTISGVQTKEVISDALAKLR